MEIFSIFYSIPVALVASSVYCFFLAKVLLRHEQVCRILRRLSYVVLSLFVVELILLATLGAVRTRGILGPGFYMAHLLFFFLGVPALGNLLVLRRKGGQPWYVAALFCTVLAFVLVLVQLGVSEALYGIDDEGGPYSQLFQRPNDEIRNVGMTNEQFVIRHSDISSFVIFWRIVGGEAPALPNSSAGNFR